MGWNRESGSIPSEMGALVILVAAGILPEAGGARVDEQRGRPMRRRQAIAALAGAMTCGPAMSRAQPAKKLPIVGFLHPGLPARGSATIDALRRDMGEQGFVD